jgi:hypothetical protein
MKLIEVKSQVNNTIDLLIEHRILNNNSHHLNYILTEINGKFYFVDAHSELVTIQDNLICPYCLQKLTINRTYKKQNGTIVQFFVKHKSKNKASENCIFKHKIAGDYNNKVDDFYKSKEFIQRSSINMLKNEMSKIFKIAIPSEYTISREEEVSIKFKYEHHQIVGVYPSTREEFICRLKTDKGVTLFCMLGENEINIRSKYKDIWSKYNVTVITFNEDKPYVNSDIEPKVNTHSKFYTTCLYSKIQENAYDDYIVEHEKHKNEQRSLINRDAIIVRNKTNEEVDRYNRRKLLERVVDHELDRVRAHLESKVGLKKVSDDLWTTNNGAYYKLKNIKFIKNDTYFYRQCPEIYIDKIMLFGYRMEVLD